MKTDALIKELQDYQKQFGVSEVLIIDEKEDGFITTSSVVPVLTASDQHYIAINPGGEVLKP